MLCEPIQNDLSSSIAASTASIILIGSVSFSTNVQATPVKESEVDWSTSILNAPIGSSNTFEGKYEK